MKNGLIAIKQKLNSAKWYIKQLIPLTYRTKYESEGKRYFVVWRMWLGNSFDIEEYEIKGA